MPKKIPETKKIVFTPHEKKKSMLISAGTSVSSAAVAAIAAQILHATGIINGDKFQQTALASAGGSISGSLMGAIIAATIIAKERQRKENLERTKKRKGKGGSASGTVSKTRTKKIKA